MAFGPLSACARRGACRAAWECVVTGRRQPPPDSAGWTMPGDQGDDTAVIQRSSYAPASRRPARPLPQRGLRLAPAEVEGGHREPLADLPGRAEDLRQDRPRP